MRIEEKRIGNFLVVEPLERRIDFRVADDFKEKMAGFVDSGNIFILLNLSQVEFIDSSGLGTIVSTLKRMGGRGDLFICGVRETVMTMFTLTRMDRIFRIFGSEQEAIHALMGKNG
jgi:anti-sigma B factor antagonist